MKAIPVYSAEEMRQYDAWVGTNHKITEDTLVEHAGRVCFQNLISNLDISLESNFLFFCGSGGNGADGLVLARLLVCYLPNVPCTILLSKPVSKQRALNLKLIEQLESLGVAVYAIPEISLDYKVIAIQNSDIIVDALLGTGVSGSLGEEVREILSLIKNHRSDDSILLAIDIPSGVQADADIMQDSPYLAGKADCTLVIQARKMAEMAPGSERYYGEVLLEDIGMPAYPLVGINDQKFILTEDYVSGLIERTGEEHLLHKGKRGHVLVIGGSEGMYGAPTLSGLAAFGSGVGKVTITFPESKTCEEASLMTLSSSLVDGCYSLDAFHKIKESLSTKQGVVIGPGLGLNEEVSDLAVLLIEEILKFNIPCVLDADALTIFSKIKHIKLSSNFVLTPHEGEFLRLENAYFGDSLLGVSRFRAVKRLSQAVNANMILKGPKTLFYELNGPVYYSYCQSASLSVAGSGDVLAGLLGGFMAKGYNASHASQLSIFIHGHAGELLDADYLDGVGVNASKIISTLSKSFTTLVS